MCKYGKGKPKVAFICVHNSCRSQIAEALGKKLASDVFESYSAGTELKDHINPDAVRLMKQIHGIDMEETQYSKLIEDIPELDVVISMGCNVSCPIVPNQYMENWGLDDPSGKSDEVFLETIRIIEEKVLQLKEKLELNKGIMEIRKAIEKEYDMVRFFYHSMIDCMEEDEYKPMWEKDIYPAPEFLRESIQNGELYIGLLNNEIAAAMVFNHQCNEGYKQYDWKINVEETRMSILHAFGVHPKFQGQGFARQMISKAFDIARESGQKVIRLDVLEGNLPAEKLYLTMGFEYRGTVKMYYEDTDWMNFKLYEYVL